MKSSSSSLLQRLASRGIQLPDNLQDSPAEKDASAKQELAQDCNKARQSVTGRLLRQGSRNKEELQTALPGKTEPGIQALARASCGSESRNTGATATTRSSSSAELPSDDSQTAWNAAHGDGVATDAVPAIPAISSGTTVLRSRRRAAKGPPSPLPNARAELESEATMDVKSDAKSSFKSEEDRYNAKGNARAAADGAARVEAKGDLRCEQRCAGCHFVVTGIAPHHCCHSCRKKSGTHSKNCERREALPLSLVDETAKRGCKVADKAQAKTGARHCANSVASGSGKNVSHKTNNGKIGADPKSSTSGSAAGMATKSSITSGAAPVATTGAGAKSSASGSDVDVATKSNISSIAADVATTGAGAKPSTSFSVAGMETKSSTSSSAAGVVTTGAGTKSSTSSSAADTATMRTAKTAERSWAKGGKFSLASAWQDSLTDSVPLLQPLLRSSLRSARKTSTASALPSSELQGLTRPTMSSGSTVPKTSTSESSDTAVASSEVVCEAAVEVKISAAPKEAVCEAAVEGKISATPKEVVCETAVEGKGSAAPKEVVCEAAAEAKSSAAPKEAKRKRNKKQAKAAPQTSKDVEDKAADAKDQIASNPEADKELGDLSQRESPSSSREVTSMSLTGEGSAADEQNAKSSESQLQDGQLQLDQDMSLSLRTSAELRGLEVGKASAMPTVYEPEKRDDNESVNEAAPSQPELSPSEQEVASSISADPIAPDMSDLPAKPVLGDAEQSEKLSSAQPELEIVTGTSAEVRRSELQEPSTKPLIGQVDHGRITMLSCFSTNSNPDLREENLRLRERLLQMEKELRTAKEKGLVLSPTVTHSSPVAEPTPPSQVVAEHAPLSRSPTKVSAKSPERRLPTPQSDKLRISLSPLRVNPWRKQSLGNAVDCSMGIRDDLASELIAIPPSCEEKAPSACIDQGLSEALSDPERPCEQKDPQEVAASTLDELSESVSECAENFAAESQMNPPVFSMFLESLDGPGSPKSAKGEELREDLMADGTDCSDHPPSMLGQADEKVIAPCQATEEPVKAEEQTFVNEPASQGAQRTEGGKIEVAEASAEENQKLFSDTSDTEDAAKEAEQKCLVDERAAQEAKEEMEAASRATDAAVSEAKQNRLADEVAAQDAKEIKAIHLAAEAPALGADQKLVVDARHGEEPGNQTDQKCFVDESAAQETEGREEANRAAEAADAEAQQKPLANEHVAQETEESEAICPAAEAAASEAEQKGLADRREVEEAVTKANMQRLADEQSVKESQEAAAARHAAEKTASLSPGSECSEGERKRLAVEHAAEEAATKEERQRLPDEQSTKEAQDAEADTLAAEKLVLLDAKAAASKEGQKWSDDECSSEEAAAKEERQRVADEQSSNESQEAEAATFAVEKLVTLDVMSSDGEQKRLDDESSSEEAAAKTDGQRLPDEQSDKESQEAETAGFSAESETTLSAEVAASGRERDRPIDECAAGEAMAKVGWQRLADEQSFKGASPQAADKADEKVEASSADTQEPVKVKEQNIMNELASKQAQEADAGKFEAEAASAEEEEKLFSDGCDAEDAAEEAEQKCFVDERAAQEAKEETEAATGAADAVASEAEQKRLADEGAVEEPQEAEVIHLAAEAAASEAEQKLEVDALVAEEPGNQMDQKCFVDDRTTQEAGEETEAVNRAADAAASEAEQKRVVEGVPEEPKEAEVIHLAAEAAASEAEQKFLVDASAAEEPANQADQQCLVDDHAAQEAGEEMEAASRGADAVAPAAEQKRLADEDAVEEPKEAEVIHLAAEAAAFETEQKLVIDARVAEEPGNRTDQKCFVDERAAQEIEGKYDVDVAAKSAAAEADREPWADEHGAQKIHESEANRPAAEAVASEVEQRVLADTSAVEEASAKAEIQRLADEQSVQEAQEPAAARLGTENTYTLFAEAVAFEAEQNWVADDPEAEKAAAQEEMQRLADELSADQEQAQEKLERTVDDHASSERAADQKCLDQQRLGDELAAEETTTAKMASPQDEVVDSEVVLKHVADDRAVEEPAANSEDEGLADEHVSHVEGASEELTAKAEENFTIVQRNMCLEKKRCRSQEDDPAAAIESEAARSSLPSKRQRMGGASSDASPVEEQPLLERRASGDDPALLERDPETDYPPLPPVDSMDNSRKSPVNAEQQGSTGPSPIIMVVGKPTNSGPNLMQPVQPTKSGPSLMQVPGPAHQPRAGAATRQVHVHELTMTVGKPTKSGPSLMQQCPVRAQQPPSGATTHQHKVQEAPLHHPHVQVQEIPVMVGKPTKPGLSLMEQCPVRAQQPPSGDVAQQQKVHEAVHQPHVQVQEIPVMVGKPTKPGPSLMEQCPTRAHQPQSGALAQQPQVQEAVHQPRVQVQELTMTVGKPTKHGPSLMQPFPLRAHQCQAGAQQQQVQVEKLESPEILTVPVRKQHAQRETVPTPVPVRSSDILTVPVRKQQAQTAPVSLLQASLQQAEQRARISIPVPAPEPTPAPAPALSSIQVEQSAVVQEKQPQASSSASADVLPRQPPPLKEAESPSRSRSPKWQRGVLEASPPPPAAHSSTRSKASFGRRSPGMFCPYGRGTPASPSGKMNGAVEMCTICCDDVPVGGAVMLTCQHGWYCKECIVRHAEARLELGDVNVSCPQCNESLPERQLRRLLPTTVFERLLSRSLERAVSSTADLRACPTPNCPMRVAMEGDDVEPRFKCSICKKSCCLRCHAQPFHKGLTCEEHAEKLRSKGRGNEDEESLQRWMTETGSKQCPTCGMAVTKQNLNTQSTQAKECHKMMCLNCRTGFCFKCLAILTPTYTCGCSIDLHGFVDPRTGKRLDHLRPQRKAPPKRAETPAKRQPPATPAKRGHAHVAARGAGTPGRAGARSADARAKKAHKR